MGWEILATEVPVGDSFTDIVIRKDDVIAVIECKRVDDTPWQFLVPKEASENIVRCRVEWHNPNAKRVPAHALNVSKVFCTECSMATGSHESSICILPKKGASSSLETLSRTLLDQTHGLAEADGIKYGPRPTYFIPVIITNAQLNICTYDPLALDLSVGALGAAAFSAVAFLRFRKTLVSRRSDDYRYGSVSLRDWSSDRERTVFIVSPEGLHNFLSGFRAFRPAGDEEYPDDFSKPPELGEDDDDRDAG